MDTNVRFEIEEQCTRVLNRQEAALLQYEILKIIYGFLPIRDLLSSSRVSKLWNEVGKIVRYKRLNKPTTLLYHLYPVERTREVVELSNEFSISESTIAWLKNESTTPHESELNRMRSGNRVRSELELRLWNSLDNQFSEPSAIICIGTSSLANYVQLRKKDEAETRINLFKRMQKICPCICVLGDGVVLTLPDNTCLENESRSRKFLPMMTGMALPKIPNLKITLFSLENSKIHQKFEVTSENCEEFLNIRANDNVKGIILFQNQRLSSSKEIILLSAVHEYLKKKPNVAFGGGLFHETFTGENNDKVIGCGLILSGDESIRVGSTAFLDPGMTTENVKKLKKFKEFGIHGDISFAFMFCCNGRGFGMHDAEHVESSLFRSEYAETPLIGAFTAGEYFHPFLPGQESSAQVASKPYDLKFGYTSVFIYISCSL